MPFLVSLIPEYFLHLFNFCRYTIKYKSFYLSPKSFIFNTKLGKRVLIGGGFYLNNCEIGDYTNLSGSEGGGIHSHIENTKIGKFCSIGKSMQVLAHGHHTDYISTFPFYSNIQSFMHDRDNGNNDITTKNTIIGNDVWIGTNVTIIGGVKIGDGAVIGAGSVVTKDVAPYAIVASNPAKLIRFRFDEYTIGKLLKYKWWNWSSDRIRSIIPAMLQSDPKEFIDAVSSEMQS